MHLTQPPSGMLRDVHPPPGKVRRGHDGGSRRTPCGQSGSLHGLKLVPAKRRCLVPPHRGAAPTVSLHLFFFEWVTLQSRESVKILSVACARRRGLRAIFFLAVGYLD